MTKGRRLTTEDFVAKSKALHGDRYDYSHAEYQTNKSKVRIICPVHGEFIQEARNHLSGIGCPKCSSSKKGSALRLSQDDFVARAKEVHNDKYDYSNSIYQGSGMKLTIICPEHGPFDQRAGNHLKGQGCPLCSKNEAVTKKNKIRAAKVASSQITKVDFVSKAREVHGDTYSYLLSQPENTNDMVTIICPIHGEFTQRVNSHLSGRGCQNCARLLGTKAVADATRFNTNDFVEKAKEVHGDRYDYSQTKYTLSGQPVKIICPHHGEFLQRPNSHLRGAGCPVCGTDDAAAKQRKSLDQFLIEAQQVHGNRYDYRLVDYKNTHDPVEIICNKHGPFKQAPVNHIKGAGCLECGYELVADQNRMGRDEFIQRARTVHGNKYGYENVDYVNNLTPVEITCFEHGSFFQQPSKHVDASQGCPSCANRDMDTTKFIERAKDVHGERYLYEKANYVGARKLITITCPEHGDFKQKADSHLRGHGCEQCVDFLNSYGSQSIEKWLKSKGIKFEREKKFDDLRNSETGRGLRLDFYLPEYNAAVEFDGRQHFEANDYWGGQPALERTQQNDRHKDQWATDKQVLMIRIRYDEEHRIPNILSSFLGITPVATDK